MTHNSKFDHTQRGPAAFGITEARLKEINDFINTELFGPHIKLRKSEAIEHILRFADNPAEAMIIYEEVLRLKKKVDNPKDLSETESRIKEVCDSVADHLRKAGIERAVDLEIEIKMDIKKKDAPDGFKNLMDALKKATEQAKNKPNLN